MTVLQRGLPHSTWRVVRNRLAPWSPRTLPSSSSSVIPRAGPSPRPWSGQPTTSVRTRCGSPAARWRFADESASPTSGAPVSTSPATSPPSCPPPCRAGTAAPGGRRSSIPRPGCGCTTSSCTHRPSRRRGGGLAPGCLRRSAMTRLQQRDALDVVRHREDTDGTERERDTVRSAALRRRNWPLTCGDAVLGDRRRRSGVAGRCESKRAHSEPSCQRAPTVTNDCSQPPWHRATETARRQVELYCAL